MTPLFGALSSQIILFTIMMEINCVVICSFSTQKLHQLQQQVEQLKEENFTLETCKSTKKFNNVILITFPLE